MAFLTFFTILVCTLTAVSAVESSNNTTSYTIYTLDSTVAADVTKNSEIAINIPRTELSTQILENQKTGSTVVQFGNGSGNKLLIWAGIHGNEEEANIATMQYLEYIKGLKFNGTLYVVPFAIPEDTSVNRRTCGPTKYTYTAWVPYRRSGTGKSIKSGIKDGTAIMGNVTISGKREPTINGLISGCTSL